MKAPHPSPPKSTKSKMYTHPLWLLQQHKKTPPLLTSRSSWQRSWRCGRAAEASQRNTGWNVGTCNTAMNTILYERTVHGVHCVIKESLTFQLQSVLSTLGPAVQCIIHTGTSCTVYYPHWDQLYSVLSTLGPAVQCIIHTGTSCTVYYPP